MPGNDPAALLYTDRSGGLIIKSARVCPAGQSGVEESKLLGGPGSRHVRLEAPGCCKPQCLMHHRMVARLGEHADRAGDSVSEQCRVGGHVYDGHADLRRQAASDVDACEAISQIEIDESDVGVRRLGKRRRAVGGDADDLEPGIFDRGFDIKGYEDFILDD